MNLSLNQLTSSVAILIVGLLCIIVGAFDSLPIGDPPLVIQNLYIRYGFLMLGTILIIVSVIITWKELIIAKNQKNSPNPTPNTPQTGATSITANTQGGDFVIGNNDKSIHISNSPKKPSKK